MAAARRSRIRLKLNDLRRRLRTLKRADAPSASLEQYCTEPDTAAAILFDAAMKNDVAGKSVADLGCGTGIFAIGAVMLGASSATGIDIDAESVKIARYNARALLGGDAADRITFAVSDILKFSGKFDTVFQNPPFGSQSRNADIPFIKKALAIADTVYTIHLADTENFIRDAIGRFGGRVVFTRSFRYAMPRMFDFHESDSREFSLILYKAVKDDNGEVR